MESQTEYPYFKKYEKLYFKVVSAEKAVVCCSANGFAKVEEVTPALANSTNCQPCSAEEFDAELIITIINLSDYF